jgi:hypothetical protein
MVNGCARAGGPVGAGRAAGRGAGGTLSIHAGGLMMRTPAALDVVTIVISVLNKGFAGWLQSTGYKTRDCPF